MLTVDEAILSRHSVRAYLSTPVSKAAIEHILEVASRAPSGTNTQPWKVHVLQGAALQRLSQAVLQAFWHEPEQHTNDRAHYLQKWREPYLSRRRKVGWDLYDLVGIKKGERERTQQFHAKNFEFFEILKSVKV